MRLAPRRFPDRIVRLREAAGDYGEDGVYVAGTVVERELRAAVQPLTLQDVDSPGGAVLSDRRKVYIPLPSALRAAAEDVKADKVMLAGEVYVVDESMAWRGHTQAILLREK